MADFNIRFWHRVADEQPFIGQVQCRFGYVPNRSKLLKILAVRKRQHGHAQWCAAYASRAQRLLHLVFQEAGKRRIGTEEPEIAGIQQQFHVDCRLLRRIFQARPLLTTVAVAHVYATVQLQQGYVPEGEAGTLCIENPFDVSVPILRGAGNRWGPKAVPCRLPPASTHIPSASTADNSRSSSCLRNRATSTGICP